MLWPGKLWPRSGPGLENHNPAATAEFPARISCQKIVKDTLHCLGRGWAKQRSAAGTAEGVMASPPGSGGAAVWQSMTSSSPAADGAADQQPTHHSLAPGHEIENP